MEFVADGVEEAVGLRLCLAEEGGNLVGGEAAGVHEDGGADAVGQLADEAVEVCHMGVGPGVADAGATPMWAGC